MKSETITPAKSLSGNFCVPGDKSISHRSLILAALAKGSSTIKNLLLGEDVLNTMRILKALGVSMSHQPEQLREGETLTVYGGKPFSPPRENLDCGNSGTTLRLMLGLLSAQPFESVLTGDTSLNRRPMDRVMKPLEAMGARFEVLHEKGRRLIRVKGAHLKGIDFPLPVSSAQVKSALLLAGLFARGETTLTEPEESRDHTERLLRAMGAKLVSENRSLTLVPGTDLAPGNVEVPGDYSSAAFFVVAGLIVPGSQITIKNVGVNPTRIGLHDALLKMGGNITFKKERTVSGEPIADLLVKSSPLKAADIRKEIPRAIDELPIFAVAATHAKGVSEVSDAGELRVKESDRIATLGAEMKKAGADFEEKKEGFKIRGGASFKAGTFKSHGDHRIAMSLAIASLTGSKPSVIEDTECVATSFPSFFNLLKSVSFP
ncbi:MAG: 3-phosphoshikimate 1-carboxyvinyltransferase [Deltaproteobacteria bacterium]|nr:3-phosphoshikimate 1-carboxyvinyltransferase [Deltaproteobacteria bacterium]